MPASPIQEAQALAQRGDAAAAAHLLEQAAGTDGDAAFELARWLLVGTPVPRDLSRARHWLARATALGQPDAALMEVALTANGSGGPADWPAALHILEAAAAHDEVAAAQLVLVRAMDLDAEGNPRTLGPPERLGTAPEVLCFRGLLTPEECRHVAASAHELLAPTVVVDPATGRNIPHPIRTSYGTVIGPTRETLAIAAINRRLAAVSGSHWSQGEVLSLLRYEPGQQYRLHFDTIAGADNQRIQTMLIYLNHGFAGGETHFPANGVTFAPRQGDVVLFANILPSGETDPASKHAGLPVISGVKWLATRWIRARPWNPWTDR